MSKEKGTEKSEKKALTKEEIDARIKAMDTASKPGLEEANVENRPLTVKLSYSTTSDKNAPRDADGNVRIGQFFAEDGHVFGKSIKMAFVYLHKERILFEKDSGSIVCSSPDGETSRFFESCDRCPSEDQRLCVRNSVVYFITEDAQKVYQIRFGKTGAAAGSALAKMVQHREGAPWNWYYEIGYQKQQRKTGDTIYMALTANDLNEETPEDVRSMAEALYNLAKETRGVKLKELAARRMQLQLSAGSGKKETEEEDTETKDNGDVPF